MNIHWEALGIVNSTVSRANMDSTLKFRDEIDNKNTTKQINE